MDSSLPPPKPHLAAPEEPLRHPEKAWRKDQQIARKPEWLRVRAPTDPAVAKTRAILRQHRLRTVCEEAGCPNIGTCWPQGHATFMILGSICTRGCTFCNVATGIPQLIDEKEPARVAAAVAALGLRHVVVTSVDRDDLKDGGAMHFVRTIRALRQADRGVTIEILTPDFLRKPQALEILLQEPPDVFNHNLETVPRLYPSVRPGARYFQSLQLLHAFKTAAPEVFTKSGLMVGLGEEDEEVAQVMDDLRCAAVDFLTIGQYLQPTPKHHAVARFVPPDAFRRLEARARSKGFLMVSASPLTRSSFHAGEDFARLRAAARRAASS